MKKHRFIRNIDLDQKELKVTDEDLSNQLRSVLRLKPGNMVILCDGAGFEAEAEIKEFGKDEVTFAVGEKVKNENKLAREIHLYASIIKKENFEIVCQKATELGIAKIIPLLSERTVKTNLKIDRLQKIILEASEQSQRGDVPGLSEIISLEEALKSALGTKVFFDKSGKDLKEIKDKIDYNSPISMFVGPEGGWTDDEIKKAKENKAILSNLGKTNLRAETASIVSIALLANI